MNCQNVVTSWMLRLLEREVSKTMLRFLGLISRDFEKGDQEKAAVEIKGRWKIRKCRATESKLRDIYEEEVVIC